MACREHLAQLREQHAAFARLGAAVLGVSFEAPERAAQFMQEEALPFPILSDPSRKAYAAFGLRRGQIGELLTWSTVRVYARGMLRGRWPRRPHTDTAQLGGDVVLDRDGRVIFAHRSRNPADRPTVGTLLEAVRQAAEAGP